jgi:predicted amidohydrolase YtcJ
VGIFDFEMEWQLCQQVFEQPDNPFRVVSVAHANGSGVRQDDLATTVEFVKNLPARNTAHFEFGQRIKLFTDGAFFSQLAMMQSPGYIDGHLGEWLMPPEKFETIARAYWHAGFKIHVHCTGDLGCELALDVLEKLQWERPRFNHGYTIEHFGFSTPEQVDRIKLLGGSVSANVYYLRELSGAYSQVGIGVERASQMARLQSCVAQNIVTTLHSDFPMAPAMPLHNAWVACTRQNIEGNVVAPQERLSLEDGLKAITINAAKVLGIQEETGSLRAGKKADFVVLDLDPQIVGVDGLLGITVLATVFEGQVHTTPGLS